MAKVHTAGERPVRTFPKESLCNRIVLTRFVLNVFVLVLKQPPFSLRCAWTEFGHARAAGNWIKRSPSCQMNFTSKKPAAWFAYAGRSPCLTWAKAE